MISRCPSCAGQVDDEAASCPSCHWDFAARRRVPPAGPAAALPPPEPAQTGLPPARHVPPLELQHFADILDEAPRPKPDAEALRRFEQAAPAPKPAPAPQPKPAAKGKPVEAPKAAKKEPAPPEAPKEASARPRAKTLWIIAVIIAVSGLAVSVWRLMPESDSDPVLPAPQPRISFPKDEDAVRLDAARLLQAPAAAPPPAAVPAPAVAKPLREPPSPEAAKAQSWAFQGTAFDVLTLRPIALAELAFQDDKGGEPVKTATDERGAFSVRLAPTPGGYRLAIAHPDYSARYLDDLTPSIRLADQKLRRQLAKALPKNESWAGASVKRDIALIPSAGDGEQPVSGPFRRSPARP